MFNEPLEVPQITHWLHNMSHDNVLSMMKYYDMHNRKDERVKVIFLPCYLDGKDGIDATAEDTCEMYFQNAAGACADKTLAIAKDETMGRVRAAENFVKTLQKREKPLNTPDEAVRLMKIIDAIYASAKTGAPVRIR